MQTRPRPLKYRRKNKLRFEHNKPGEPGFELRPYQVVLRPLVTEKGTHQSTRYNAYAFEVNRAATKTDIKKAIQEMFNVRVEHVTTQIRHGKKRRFKFKIGQMGDWKKAVVTLNAEDKIDFF
jgi:large subunit ribosomal protein L23